MGRKKIINIILVVILLVSYAISSNQPSEVSKEINQSISNLKSDNLSELYQNKISDTWVEVTGIVTRLLADDNEGSRHQRFIIKVNEQTVLVSHNIDLAKRIDTLGMGDKVDVRGEYEWNDRGGVIHWTHHDPMQRIKGGWIKHRKEIYK